MNIANNIRICTDYNTLKNDITIMNQNNSIIRTWELDIDNMDCKNVSVKKTIINILLVIYMEVKII